MNAQDAPSPATLPPASAARRHALGRRRSISRLSRLCLKELREILRDRRTIATLVLMPLLVYPLLSITFQRLMFASLDTNAPLHFVIGLNAREALPLVEDYLARGDELIAEQEKAQPPPAASRGLPVPGSPAPATNPSIRWVAALNLEQAVEDASIDLAILVHPDSTLGQAGDPGTQLQCELLYRENSPLSNAALDYLSRRFRAVNDDALRAQVASLGGRAWLPAEAINRKVGGATAAVSLTTLVPLILILMTITGAVYPAIDLTAGERERGTLEMLMAAPVPRLSLLAAKYVAVLTVALLTAGANLLAMSITLISSGLGELVFGGEGLSLLVIVEVLALLVLFAAFFSAILLALTSFARSFKEAQAYLIPLMLLSLAPGMLSLMPGLELNGLLAVTPLVNIVLLARDVFEGTVVPVTAGLAIFSTALYALGAIAAAARVFGTDALLYGSEGGWGDLVARPRAPREAASLTSALFCTVVLVPCLVLFSGYLGQQSQLGMAGRLLWNALATTAFFAGLPLLAAILQRVRLTRGFGLAAARPLAFCAALLLGLVTWPLAHEIFLLNRWLGLTTVTADRVEMVADLLDQWRQLSPWLILFSLALVPAVCEELFFRGYLFQALWRAASAGRAIWVSALAFGIFHVVAGSLAAPERFLPTLFLGLILGWVRWQSGSILPGIVLHSCHNGLLLMLAYYRDQLAALGWGVQDQSHLPVAWLVASAFSIIIAGGVLYLAGRRPVLEQPNSAC